MDRGNSSPPAVILSSCPARLVPMGVEGAFASEPHYRKLDVRRQSILRRLGYLEPAAPGRRWRPGAGDRRLHPLRPALRVAPLVHFVAVRLCPGRFPQVPLVADLSSFSSPSHLVAPCTQHELPKSASAWPAHERQLRLGRRTSSDTSGVALTLRQESRRWVSIHAPEP
jgi:hypothetical protein